MNEVIRRTQLHRVAIRAWNRPMFDALHNKDYRWLWLARLAASAAYEMSAVAQGWLVFTLTGSALALSWVSTAGSASMFLLSAYGGILCDRMPKRDLLAWTRLGATIVTLVVTILIATDAIQLWHLAVSALITGTFYAFMMPAQQTIVSDLVDRDALLNAVSLNSISMGLTGIFGASLAGVLIALVGVEGVYALMVLAYVVALLAILKLPRIIPEATECRSVWADLSDGVRYLIGRPLLLALLMVTLSRVVLLMPYRTFMPKFSSDVMGFDSSGLGLLMAAPGAGSLLSSLVIASLGNLRGKAKLMVGACLVAGLALIGFGSTRSLAPALLVLALIGAASNAGMIANNTLLQTGADPAYRGRVMSVYMMMWGLTPLGTLPAGAVADQLGVPIVIIAQGVLLMATVSGIVFWRRRLLEMD